MTPEDATEAQRMLDADARRNPQHAKARRMAIDAAGEVTLGTHSLGVEVLLIVLGAYEKIRGNGAEPSPEAAALAAACEAASVRAAFVAYELARAAE